MSCETPVASTHLGGIPEVVKNDENGILVPVNNSLKFDRSNRTIYQRINMSE
jgi:glycosyltransferase involved in cell wall biosynthesis